MTDYTTPTGTGGTMLIRDNGWTVDYFIKAGSTQTFANGKGWSATGTAGGTFNYPSGANWLLLGTATITTSQNVTLHIDATGTSGLGGPTDFTVYIGRATVPTPPTGLAWSNVGSTTAQINFSGSSSDGGSGIDYYLVRYGTSNPPENGGYTEFSTGTGANPRTGLTPGTTYYARVYAHNAVGYSSPSAVQAVTTLDVPSVPTSVSAALLTIGATSTVRVNYGAPSSNGGSAVTGYDVRWGTTNPPTGSPVADSASPYDVAGLAAGSTQYFQVRANNAIGAGAWSGVVSVGIPNVPDAPAPVSITLITPTTMRYMFTFTGKSDNGSAVTGYDYQYSESSAFSGAPVLTAPSNGVLDQTGLIPSTLYYYRVRAKNAVGVSAWSSVISATTIPAVRVMVGGVWKLAIPYVKVAGVWKIAQPYVKVNGVWKKTV